MSDDYYVWVCVLESRDRKRWSVFAARDLSRSLEQYTPKDSDNFPNRLVAVYRYSMPKEINDGMGAKHPACIEYEHFIAAQMMKRVGSEWYNVISTLGKFLKSDTFPEKMNRVDFPIMCFCGYPAELRYTKTGQQYYSCCRRNREWIRDRPLPSFINLECTKQCGFFAHRSMYSQIEDHASSK